MWFSLCIFSPAPLPLPAPEIEPRGTAQVSTVSEPGRSGSQVLGGSEGKLQKIIWTPRSASFVVRRCQATQREQKQRLAMTCRAVILGVDPSIVVSRSGKWKYHGVAVAVKVVVQQAFHNGALVSTRCECYKSSASPVPDTMLSRVGGAKAYEVHPLTRARRTRTTFATLMFGSCNPLSPHHKQWGTRSWIDNIGG